ncbi:MAG: DUF4239 domain-containing protein [Candidatus Obscuribacterales bacterium]|nr:DUF4239 domain-containing protein [Candidatus Obscuribacterales bacterium]
MKAPLRIEAFETDGNMDSLLDCLLIVGGSTLVSVIGMFLVRKKISRQSLESCHEVGGIMLAIVGTLYAIVVGLIVVNSQSRVDAASQMAVTESNMLSNIYHLSKTFREPARHKIRQTIHEYAVAVTKENWAKVETNQEKEETIPAYRRLWSEITAYNPQEPNEQQCYASMLSNMEDLSAARKFRTVAAKNGLSPVLWSVLIAGGVGIVLFTYFFFVENMLAQTLMTAFVTMFISMNVYLIHICQNPYRPELGAKDAGFGGSFSPAWFIDAPEKNGKSDGDHSVSTQDKVEQIKTENQ